MNLVCRCLRLDANSLKKWMGKGVSEPGQKQVSRKSKAPTPPTAFLELLTPAATSEIAELIHTFAGHLAMLQITPQMRILVAIEAVDGRKGIDSLVQLCRETLDADARQNGKRLGRPATAACKAADVRRLFRKHFSKSEIARRLQIGRTSVRRLLGSNYDGE